MDAVFSESLAFGQMKRRAVSARSYRSKIPPINGTSFLQDQTIQIDLPGNLAGQYYDFSSMYLKMKVTSGTTACVYDRAGGLGLIKRLQISTSGANICDINNYGLLATLMLDADSSSEWKAGYGAQLLGTCGDALRGVGSGIGGTRVFCIPLVLNPLFNTTPHRLIPAFSLSSLQIRITLDSNQSAVSTLGATASVLAYSEVEMVCMMTELSPAAQAQVNAATNGKYNILANSFMNSQASLALNATQLTANLGFSVSSLERIIAIHRPSATVTSISAFSQGNRSSAGLSQYVYLINSEQYPSRSVIVDAEGSESLAEALIADHALVDWNKGSSFNNGVVVATNTSSGLVVGALSGSAPNLTKSDCFMLKDGTGLTAGNASTAGAVAAVSDVGTFYLSTDFESGLATGKSATMYSGVSTIASNVQWLGTYSASHAAETVDFFAQFSVLVSLDMMGSGVFSISV
jgi:hypothetical protein